MALEHTGYSLKTPFKLRILVFLHIWIMGKVSELRYNLLTVDNQM
jgi:hypothetical protein